MSSAGSGVRAAIVTVGDELLSGETVDTNAAWLGRELAVRGIPVRRRYTVGDDEGEIRRAVAEAAGDAELILVTGGLGPTPDDLTRDAIAALAGVPLLEDPEVLGHLVARARERGTALAEPNRRVAQVPLGAVKLHNPFGTAPGLALDVAGALALLLPGVPRELRGICREGLGALLDARFGDRLTPVHVRVLRTTGIPESVLAQDVARALPGGTGAIRLAFLPDLRGVDLRFTAVDLPAEEARARFDALERALADVLGPWRFEAPSGDLAEAVSLALRKTGHTLAVAESCTGGLIAKRLTDFPGASDVLAGGVVAYANDVKISVLGVPPGEIEAHGAVSEEVARSMALGAARLLGARAGIGVTGVAGPGGGTPEKPVGAVWYAAAVDGRATARSERFPGDREAVRERAAQAALFLLLRTLEGRSFG